ncbi:MAG TPA: hypothetical protein PLD05_15670, partial [Thermogutta sp.]|nr:hypothetical protein [Thermogutta sp.]
LPRPWGRLSLFRPNGWIGNLPESAVACKQKTAQNHLDPAPLRQLRVKDQQVFTGRANAIALNFAGPVLDR